MPDNIAHLSDEELLLFSDQEMQKLDAARARRHVAQCPLCHTRLAKLESVSSEFYLLHEQDVRALGPRTTSARNVLKARLAKASEQAVGWRLSTFIIRQRLVRACLTLLLITGIIWIIYHSLGTSFMLHSSEAKALPSRTLTPGLTRVVDVADLCSRQDLDNDPPVDTSLKQAVFKEYGVAVSSEKEYELDYLITPALGGAETIQNLWPQPYSATWNSRVKDQLESHLHTLVCQGDIRLTTAQNDIASDWIAAYKKYFNTTKPAPAMPGSTRLDSAWKSSPGHRSTSVIAFTAFHDVALLVPTPRTNETAMSTSLHLLWR
jgi:hypothetical protein